MMRKPLVFLASIIISCFLAMPAPAEPLEEVIVYSTLDQRALQEHTGSLSVVDASSVAIRDAQHIDQLAFIVPNLNFSGGAARGRFPQVRGIGDIEQFVDPKAYPSVGLVVDGIELNGLFGAGLLFDSSQVEVLRGPQGTRFGASALAGAINIISEAADNVDNNYIEAGIGDFGTHRLGAAFGGELAASTSARVALQQYSSDGYIENKFLDRDDTGSFDEFIAKASLVQDIGDSHKLRMNALHIDNDNGYDAFSLGNEENTTFSDMPGFDRQRINAAGILHSMTIAESSRLETRVTALNADTGYGFDEDWTDPGICNPPAVCPFGGFSSFDAYRREREEYTADIRIVTEQIIAGAYFQDRNTDLDRDRTGDFPLAFTSEYKTRRKALYAQWDTNLDAKTGFSLGARIESFEDDYTDSFLTNSTSDDNLWSAEASFTRELSNDQELFLLASRGHKAGGVNTDATSNKDAIDPVFQPEITERLRYKSESLTNYELGWSASTPAHHLKSTLIAFYNKRNNPQFETFLYDAFTSFLFVGYQDNAASAESHGVEWQFDWIAGNGLEVAGSLSYLESSIKNFRVYDFDQFAFIDKAHKEQPRSSSYRYHLAITDRLSPELSAVVQLEGRDGYQNAYYFDSDAGNVNLAHASLIYDIDKFRLTLWMRNILDQEWNTQGLYFGNDPRDGYANHLYTQAGEPRNFGLSLRYRL